MEEDNRYTIQTTKTSLQILHGLRELDGASVSELADHLNKSKSSVFKHLQTLQSSGFVVATETGYTISLQFLTYGIDVRDRLELDDIAKPDVEWLAEATDARVNLAAREKDRVICIRSSRPNEIVSDKNKEGEYLSLHNTALGKAILAHLPKMERIQLVDEFRDDTEAITEDSESFEKLQAIREQGFATDVTREGSVWSSIAAPIYGKGESVVGSIGISIQRERVDEKKLEDTFGNVVMNAAQKTSKRLQINDQTP